MEETEILVLDDTENTEETAEQTPEKLYTEEEFRAKMNEGFGKRLARKEAKIRKEYKPMEDLVEAMMAGTGKRSIAELTAFVKEFYEEKGVEMPKKAPYTDRDIAVLARSDAEDIISAGPEEISEELKRLVDLGTENMSSREKAVFERLSKHQKDAQRVAELSEIGVPKEVYESADFRDFAEMFTSGTPIKKIYDTYQKTRQKEEIKPMGPVASSVPENNVKDYYSPDEVDKFSRDYLDKHPEVYRAVMNSMQKW